MRPAVALGRDADAADLAVARGLMTAVLAGSVLSLAGCAGSGWLSGTALCEAAGGTYTGGTCSRSGPAQQAAQEMCETSGACIWRVTEQCAFGMGGCLDGLIRCRAKRRS